MVYGCLLCSVRLSHIRPLLSEVRVLRAVFAGNEGVFLWDDSINEIENPLSSKGTYAVHVSENTGHSCQTYQYARFRKTPMSRSFNDHNDTPGQGWLYVHARGAADPNHDHDGMRLVHKRIACTQESLARWEGNFLPRSIFSFPALSRTIFRVCFQSLEPHCHYFNKLTWHFHLHNDCPFFSFKITVFVYLYGNAGNKPRTGAVWFPHWNLQPTVFLEPVGKKRTVIMQVRVPSCAYRVRDRGQRRWKVRAIVD